MISVSHVSRIVLIGLHVQCPHSSLLREMIQFRSSTLSHGCTSLKIHTECAIDRPLGVTRRASSGQLATGRL